MSNLENAVLAFVGLSQTGEKGEVCLHKDLSSLLLPFTTQRNGKHGERVKFNGGKIKKTVRHRKIKVHDLKTEEKTSATNAASQNRKRQVNKYENQRQRFVARRGIQNSFSFLIQKKSFYLSKEILM